MSINWSPARDTTEIKNMVDQLAQDDRPNWYGGTGVLFGTESLWPLMIFVPEFITEGRTVSALTSEVVLDHLKERLMFMISKTSNGRSLYASKARDQVNMLLWILGQEDRHVPTSAGFGESTSLGVELLEMIS